MADFLPAAVVEPVMMDVSTIVEVVLPVAE